jgi:predicted NAD/FAD-binding protein
MSNAAGAAPIKLTAQTVESQQTALASLSGAERARSHPDHRFWPVRDEAQADWEALRTQMVGHRCPVGQPPNSLRRNQKFATVSGRPCR